MVVSHPSICGERSVQAKDVKWGTSMTIDVDYLEQAELVVRFVRRSDEGQKCFPDFAGKHN